MFTTTARGIKTPIIKPGDDLANIVVNSILDKAKRENFAIQDRDVIGITEAVVSISQNNYATLEDIKEDLIKKYPNQDHIGLVFPILSRNRFSIILKAIAQTFKHITMLLSYPKDEVGNSVLDESLLMKQRINPYLDIISEAKYQEVFYNFKHPFTGVNMVDYYRELVKNEQATIDFIFANDPLVILKSTTQVLTCDIHTRAKTKQTFLDHKVQVYGLDDIMTKPILKSGFNEKYGLLGSNAAGENKVKLFPNDAVKLLEDIQKKIAEKTQKNVEVFVYGDGAFKDPIGGIWELADPVVSPFYTKGLEGSPNELKLKYLLDQSFHDLKGEALDQAIRKAILEKDNNLVGNKAALGTTPRRYIDLLGSLCDLMSGSGDKGTPVVLIQNYFTHF